MNLVERWFGHPDNKAINRGVFLSVEDPGMHGRSAASGECQSETSTAE
jgi:hypothetical protein